VTPPADHDHVISTGKGEFTLEDLGRLMPGMAELMPLIGERTWKCFYAGQAKNRALAAFQLKEAVNLMKKGAILRPRYAEDLDTFINGEVATVLAAIDAEDWDAFEPAFSVMVDRANEYHVAYRKSYLKWKVPEMPPPDLDLTAT
jgi:hypothetical protein